MTAYQVRTVLRQYRNGLVTDSELLSILLVNEISADTIASIERVETTQALRRIEASKIPQ